TNLEQLSKLSSRLERRYSERQKNLDDRKAQVFNSNNSPVPGTSVKVQTSQVNGLGPDLTDDDNEDEYTSITPLALVESIQVKSNQISKVLIIDIRSAHEFAESSIAANKMHASGEVNIINIPSDTFTPALTYSTLAKKVQFGIAKDALERRRSMDNVVIMDKGTHSFEKDSKCVLLAMALFKVYRSEERRVGKECSTRWVA